nr:MAG TPA: hypothetical protein [Caudoviricetes sp.]
MLFFWKIKRVMYQIEGLCVSNLFILIRGNYIKKMINVTRTHSL